MNLRNSISFGCPLNLWKTILLRCDIEHLSALASCHNSACCSLVTP
jgi:hypothetical protein